MPAQRVDLLDVSALGYEERLVASSLQGLANRAGPRLFLDHGCYDEPGARRTNSVQMTEENWRLKFREYLERNDLHNLDYYREVHDLAVTRLPDLRAALAEHAPCARGLVVWDPELIESVNLALTMAGVRDLLVVHPDGLAEVRAATGLSVVEDLRGRFRDRVELYRWSFEHLFHQCRQGQIAWVEPTWRRSEFSDYIVQNRLFAVSLASFEKGGLRSLGQKLLLLLVVGPFGFRNLLFATRLDRALRRLGVRLLAWRSPEARLGIRMQRAVRADPYPTIFGWHTERDDEFSFMLLLSANGMRLVPTFLAGNYSFHSRLSAGARLEQEHIESRGVSVERDKVYLTFVLSDGDQLALMNTAEVGNWRRPERGSIPFNWEVQPLLAEIAPALLGFYYHRRTGNDLLVAGPSGAGYVIPPLVPDLPEYLRQSAAVCGRAGIRVVSSYNGDPARRTLRELRRAQGGFLGYLAGYFHLGRTPSYLRRGLPFVAYAWPHLREIPLRSEEVLSGIRALVEAPGPRPRFVACHLSAYWTTVSDVAAFLRTLDPAAVRVVRADEFLIAAQKHLESTP